MIYSASDEYHKGLWESQAHRTRDVVCSLRCFERQPTRCRVLGWTQDAEKSLGLKNSLLGEVNHGGRKEINAGYFGAMRSAKIVVTCNPSHWEGDFRLFEAMVSGALVFVDEMWGPQPFPLKHKEHVIVYNTKDQGAFTEQLKYYIEHPDEARRIAHQGYLHVLKYHRSANNSYGIASSDSCRCKRKPDAHKKLTRTDMPSNSFQLPGAVCLTHLL